MERLSGRTTIVTGAARGIGRAIATAFAAEGASVALVDRRGEEAEEVSDSLGTKTVIALEADVSDEHAVTRAVHRVQEPASLPSSPSPRWSWPTGGRSLKVI
jgi:NAD(P)-dependent dehydrogenase (short-subunit alcohol dehydrogenase family)